MKATLTLQDGRSITLEEEDVEEILKKQEKQKPTVAFDGTLLNDDTSEGFYIDSSQEPKGKFRIKECYNCKVDWACFDTKENAQKFDNRMQALWHIKKWVAENDNFVTDWENEYKKKLVVVYDHNSENFILGYHLYCIENPDFPHMSSDEIVERCIIECKEHLEVYFNVK